MRLEVQRYKSFGLIRIRSFLIIKDLQTTAYVGKCAAGFAKTVRNPSFSGGAEALNVRGKTDLVFWLDFFCYFFSSRKKM
jgi:hypothetical protein